MPKDKNKSKAAAEEHNQAQKHDAEPTGKSDTSDDIVSALRAQVQASEDRHGESLSHMRQHLGNLSGDVTEITRRIPEDLPRKLEGIETGLETLNERVAQITTPGDSVDTPEGDVAEVVMDDSGDTHTDAPDQAPAEDAPDDTPIDWALLDDDTAEPAQDAAPEQDMAPVHDDQTPPVEFEVAYEDEAVASAPAALKSAADDEPVQDTPEPAAPASTRSVDPFDMVDTSLPGDPGSPWDAESAEALTQLYDAPAPVEDASLMPARTPDPELGALPQSYETAQPAAHHDVVDRNWLDAKFTEIAERIELTLSELDPAKSSAEIGERIQSFENRVGSVLEDVATRADVGSLRDMETQMQRLDSIESTLHEVVARFTEGGGLVQAAELEGMSAGGVDPNQIADVAAARISDHLSASGHMADNSAITDVRTMIEGFLSEHREGTEQTATTLDTIQQAMVRILDRLDVLEAAGGIAVAGGDLAQGVVENYQHPADEADEVALASQGWVDTDAEGPGSDDDIALAQSADPVANAEDEAMVEFHERDAAPGESTNVDLAPALAGSMDEAGVEEPLAGSEAEPQPDPGQGGQPSPDLLSDRHDAVTVPVETNMSSRDAIEKIRHDFIADAQRAKAQAAQAAAEAASTGGAKASRRSVLAGMKSNGDEASGGFFANKTRRLLVGALLAVIAIQSAIFLMPRNEESALEQPAPASVTEPSKQKSETETTPKLDKSSTLLPNDGFSPGVGHDTVLNDLRLAAVDAEDRASGAVDLPFGLMLQQTTAKDWTKEGRPIFDQNPADVTQIAAHTDDANNGGRVYKAPAAETETGHVAMPPITVGPSSLRTAAANGDPSAQFEVATRLSEGKGTKQNFKEAATWFKRSAGQGFAQAQYRLGTLYERGLGVSRDVNRAQVWYLRAAEQGNIRAMHNLAVLSAGQSSGKPDYARAARWFLKAAESGLADSQFNAGVLYENGLGVSKDLVKAYKWYTLAARTGDKESLKRSQKIRSHLAIDTLGKAETAVRSFKPAKVEPLVNNARLAGQEWKTRQNG